jgi:ribosomal protein S18 acetylase RimI-like enzyme
MEIRRYSKADDDQLFDMMREEGPDWECYYGEASIEKYRKALASSASYVAYEDGMLCGYVRCRDDDGIIVYVYDLLVKRSCRGRSIGQKLMEKICADFQGQTVYVMSGVDEYYEKLGYPKEGSIYRIPAKA